MKATRTIIYISLILLAGMLLTNVSLPAKDQEEKESITEKSLIIANDLSNQRVTSFEEDAQGHIWIGTFRGLNKYNGKEYHQYYCTDDSTSLPDNQIQSLLCDSKNRLWIGTVNGICLYTDKDNFHRIPISYETHQSYNVIQILENKDGTIFLNMNDYLCAYNPKTDSFDCVIPRFDPELSFNLRCFIDNENNLWTVNTFGLRCYNSTTLELKDSIPAPFPILYAYIHKEQELWLSGDQKLILFNLHNHTYIQPPKVVSDNPLLRQSIIYNIHPYGNNSLLLSSYTHGFFLYNYIGQTLIHQDEEGFPFEVPPFKTNVSFTDSQQNLWLGSSIGQGFKIYNNLKERFNANNYLRTFTKNKMVVSLAIDRESRIWFTVLNEGLYLYDPAIKKITPINLKNILSQVTNGSPSFTFVDKNNFLWLGIYPNIIAQLRYINGNLQCENLYTSVPSPLSIAQAEDGTIWVGSYSENIYALRPGEKKFIPITLFPKEYNFTSCILALSSGELLVNAFGQVPLLIQPENRIIQKLEVSKEDWEKAIHRSIFVPSCAYEDTRGNIWIGTVANGLLRYNPSTHNLETMQGISCTDICSIEEDKQGQIWISTQYGLNKYDYTTGLFMNYHTINGIGGDQFYDRSSCRLPDGKLVFGGTHGLTFFDPIDVAIKQDIPLVFENLKIHNRIIRPGIDKNIDKSLAYKPDIYLNHDEDGFSISFAALDYGEYERINYQYKMEGIDKYWVDAQNSHTAYYANLPSGKYTFKVRIFNNDKSIMEKENALRIIVKPAPWDTWWAWCIYLLVIAAIASYILHIWRRIWREKKATRQARQEKDREQQINRMNMRFFANVSHEFRTPLTMISGPVRQLCQNPKIEGESKELLYIIERNVRRMLRLINQLMDFNKLEDDKLKLQVKRIDIIPVLKNFVNIFQVNANEKGITLNTTGLEDVFLTWIDVDKLEKILSNLFSNAIKFTSYGGRIDLSFDTDGQYAKIVVADTGSGIPENQLEKVFERYYQLDNQNTGIYNQGTGIGLYYARQLAQLHHGSLKASNREDGGTGSVFTLLLPTNDLAYSDEERSLSEEKQEIAYPLSNDQLYQPIPNKDKQEEKQTILVVDDDTEVVHYLKMLLSPYYKVICRFSANEAFKAITEVTPDLVLSDVVMPKRSGYDLCRKIKEDLQLCHIPVVLLTAKVTVESQVEGLNIGADAYVTKPFEPDYLLALINSQLKNREKIRNLLHQSTQTDKIEENVLSPKDNAFMTELYQLMEKELSNPELDVAYMTDLLKISRTKFYYKVKGLTGENPGAFFKTYKLNRAAELIQEGKYTISEVADKTGFNTLSHFSTSFKKQFGKTPSEYGKS